MINEVQTKWPVLLTLTSLRLLCCDYRSPEAGPNVYDVDVCFDHERTPQTLL